MAVAGFFTGKFFADKYTLLILNTIMKLILFLLFTLSFNANALPNTIYIYSAVASGVRNTQCRTLFTIYAEKYNAKVVFITKPGAGGVIAMEEMYKDNNFSVLCSGLSESVFNNTIYPGHEEAHNALTLITLVTESQTSFYTRIDFRHNNILDTIAECKPITIGRHHATSDVITREMFGSCPVTYVPYRHAMEAVASLLDGTLDIYSDSSSLEPLVVSKKLKSIGKINPSPNTSGPNITKNFPIAAKLRRFVSIATSSANSREDIEELNKRLRPIILSKEFAPTLETTGPALNTTVDEANTVVTEIKNIIKAQNVKFGL